MSHSKQLALSFSLASTLLMTIAAAKMSHAQPFFIGGYGEGIYASTLEKDGAMADPVLIAKQPNPSFFCFHPKLDVLYVVTETNRSDAKSPATVVAYRLERRAYFTKKTPPLLMLNSRKIDGDVPCHVTTDSEGKCLIIANYTSGSVVVFPIATDGSIQPESCNIVHKVEAGKKRSNGHCSVVAPGDRWVLVADLGNDRVYVYELDASKGTLTPGPTPWLELPAGAGPRHLSFHPNKKYVYIINETNMTMTAATWDSNSGKLAIINQTSTLPPNTTGGNLSTAEVLVHPNGRFVYGSNRGHDTIVAMGIDPKSGAIKRLNNYSTLGKTPRNFRIDPSGSKLIAENQGSDTIYSFNVDSETGSLTSTGKSITVKAPACIRFLNEEPLRQ
jgi:6-phosphogluconolactonase